MFRKFCVHLQEDYIVHAVLYGMFSMRIFKALYQVEGCARYGIKLKHYLLVNITQLYHNARCKKSSM